MKTVLASGFGGLAAAFGSMLCCTGPLVLAAMGLSGAALSAWRPWRPLFVVVAVGLFLLAFHRLERAEERTCGEAEPEGDADACGLCASPARLRRARWALYALAAVSLLLLVSPRWAPFVF